MILGLNKVYPTYMGNPAKVAVKTISMGVIPETRHPKTENRNPKP